MVPKSSADFWVTSREVPGGELLQNQGLGPAGRAASWRTALGQGHCPGMCVLRVGIVVASPAPGSG